MATAKDIMTTCVITTTACACVKDAADLLSKNKISGMPVVDEENKVIGIVSEADILEKKGETVGDIMAKEVIHVCEDTSVEDIASILAKHKIKRVPVVKEGKLVGIVSRADVVAAIAKG